MVQAVPSSTLGLVQLNPGAGVRSKPEQPAFFSRFMDCNGLQDPFGLRSVAYCLQTGLPDYGFMINRTLNFRTGQPVEFWSCLGSWATRVFSSEASSIYSRLSSGQQPLLHMDIVGRKDLLKKGRG